MERVIIVGVDRSARSRAAADWAAREALRRRLPLRVVHVTPPDGADPAELWPYDPETVADRVVAELVERHPSLTVRSVHLSGAAGPLLGSVTEHAEIVVLGLRGEGGTAGVAVGSTASHVVGASLCPLVLVPGTFPRPEVPGGPGPVTVGIDARDPVDGALGFAFETARLHRVRLHAVHPWQLPGEAAALPFAVPEEDRARWEDQEVQLLSDALRPWRGKYPDVHVLEDVVLLTPAEALAHASGGSELVVIGRRGPADAHDLLRHAQCPVAVVPS